MKLRHITSNMIELELKNGTIILFSYSKPVAACIGNDPDHAPGFYRTAKRHSVTTSRHISRWLDGASAEEKPQDWFNSLLP